MMNRLTIVCVVTAGLLGASGSALAHHGAAAYEVQSMTTVSATVTDFEWRNPHALLHFDVTDDRGTVASWTAETAGLVILVRAGWQRHVLKAGDRITAVGRRATNGTNAMLLQRVVLSTGQTLNSFVPPK